MGSIDKRDNTPQLLNRLRMRQVALILAIDERQTLRAAATELGLTQPAATKMLQELEDAKRNPITADGMRDMGGEAGWVNAQQLP